MTMRFPRVRSQVLAAGTLLVLGLLYGALAVGEGLGTVGDTGAGFFPLVVAVVLVAASVTVLVQSRRETPPTDSPPTDSPPTDSPPADSPPADSPDGDEVDGRDEVHWWRIAGVLGAALLVPAVGETVDMVVTLSISLVLMAKVMGVSRWWRAVVLGIAFGAATWLIFAYWLFVPLPAGTLGLV
jgi:hypothetical protein